MKLYALLATALIGGAAHAGDISAGPATTWGTLNEHSEEGQAVDARVTFRDTGLRPYVALLVVPGHVDVASVGIGYRVNLTRRIYLEPALGAGIHWGDMQGGTRGMFHLSGALGYRVTSRIAVELAAQHWSNAETARPNHGLNAVSVRVAWRY